MISRGTYIPKKNRQEEFIKRCTVVHNGRYDYSLVEYVNTSTKVAIICKTHGVFYQNILNHRKGTNCPECTRLGRYKSHSKQFYIDKCNNVHGDTYDYSLVDCDEISNTQVRKEKFPVICKEHGVFYQTLYHHYNCKIGCPKCGRARANGKIRSNRNTFSKSGYCSTFKHELDTTYFYVIGLWNDEGEEFVKVGISKNINKRYTKANLPYNYEIICQLTMQPPFAWELEQNYLKNFKRYKYTPKIKFDGMYECFTKDLLKHVGQNKSERFRIQTQS